MRPGSLGGLLRYGRSQGGEGEWGDAKKFCLSWTSRGKIGGARERDVRMKAEPLRCSGRAWAAAQRIKVLGIRWCTS